MEQKTWMTWIDHILSQIFKIITTISLKHEAVTDNPPIEIYVNNRVTFKIKTGYYLQPLTLKTMKLLGSTTSKITKNKNGENVPHFQVVYWNKL